MFNEEKVSELIHSFFIEEEDNIKNILFGKIMKEIKTNPLVNKEYSKEELEGVVRNIIEFLRFKKENEQLEYIKHRVNEINKELQNSLGVWNFIIPIDNVEIKLRDFKIGNVTICKFTSYKRTKMKNRIWNIIKENPHYNLQSKKEIVNFNDERIISQLQDKTCALVQITGRLDKAHIKAYEKVETSIAILKFYLMHNDPNRYFHIVGKVMSNKNRVTLRYKEDEKYFDPSVEKVGPLFPFELDKETVETMHRLGFDKVNNILKKENPSPLELKLFNSIRLLGAAYDVIITKSSIRTPIYWGTPVDRDKKPSTVFEEIAMNDRFVKLFIVLESLFIFNENESLQSNLSERLAYLLTNQYEERKNIISYIKSLYNLRSSYIHHGKSKLNHTILNYFTHFVRNSIERLIYVINRYKLKNEEGLRLWFDKKKFS